MRKGDNLRKFKNGLIGGLGWAFGVTIGFVIVSIVALSLLRSAGGIPVIGNMIANVVEATQDQLIKRTPYYPNTQP